MRQNRIEQGGIIDKVARCRAPANPVLQGAMTSTSESPYVTYPGDEIVRMCGKSYA